MLEIIVDKECGTFLGVLHVCAKNVQLRPVSVVINGCLVYPIEMPKYNTAFGTKTKINKTILEFSFFIVL